MKSKILYFISQSFHNFNVKTFKDLDLKMSRSVQDQVNRELKWKFFRPLRLQMINQMSHRLDIND